MVKSNFYWAAKTCPMNSRDFKVAHYPFMPKNYFGKLLFPRLHLSQYNRRFKIVAATISPGLIVAGSMITIMILRGVVGQ
jgi:hypothetical protein